MDESPKVISVEEAELITSEFWNRVQRTIYIDVKAHNRADLQSWGLGRRTSFLINEDMPPPFSVDKNVWRSALTEADLEYFESPHSPLEFEIQDSLLQATFGYKAFSLEAILYHLRTDFSNEHIIGFSPNLSLGEATFSQFPTLGFDVADSWRLSGICNCGYDLEEKLDLRERFGNALNIHHLFERKEDAYTFAKACGERVKVHAPFRVFQIFDLRQ